MNNATPRVDAKVVEMREGCHGICHDAIEFARVLEREAAVTKRTGIELIAAERLRQVVEEEWSAQHDAQHSDGALAAAAAVYAAPVPIYRDATQEELKDDDSTQSNYIQDRDNLMFSLRHVWPWLPGDLKRGDRVRELVKAGALIAAEIDRLHQAEEEEIKPAHSSGLT